MNLGGGGSAAPDIKSPEGEVLANLLLLILNAIHRFLSLFTIHVMMIIGGREFKSNLHTEMMKTHKNPVNNKYP